MAQAADSRRIVFSGWLHKQGKVRTTWNHRFFVLYSNRELEYYESDRQVECGEPAKGVIDLSKAESFGLVGGKDSETSEVPESCPADLCFEICVPADERVWLLATEEAELFDRWIAELSKQVSGDELFRGVLFKRGALNKAWKQRFAVVYSNKNIKYFKDETSDKPLGFIDLSNSLALCPCFEALNGRAHAFQLKTRSRLWAFGAVSYEQRRSWVRAIIKSMGSPKNVIVLKKAMLEKRGALRKAWKERLCVLCKDWLLYFSDFDAAKKMLTTTFFDDEEFNKAYSAVVTGSIPLQGATVRRAELPGRSSCFEVAVAGSKRVFEFAAPSDSEAADWIHGINGRADLAPSSPQ